jgi:chromatin remodeling complex protein RSC6
MSSSAKTVVKKVATKKESPAASVPAPAVVAPVAAATVAPAKKEKVAKKAADASASSAPAPVAAVVAPAEPPAASAIASASAAAANAEPVTTVSQDIEALTTQLQSVRDAAISGLKALSKLSKRVAREVKEAGRRRRRNKVAPVEGAAPVAKRPTIFTTPVTLRDSLCAFLGKPKGSQMTPADVTKAFSTYVESHKLKDAEKGHTIHPDAAMRNVLGVKEGEPLTYRNIQTYLYKLYDLPKRATSASA